MLEWYVQTERSWSWKPGDYGKGLRQVLPPELWAELESTYVGAKSEDNSRALFATIDLFRAVAFRVAERLNYEYPQALHDRVVLYLQNVLADAVRVTAAAEEGT
jgi:aminoglycoside 6-adenylyltransferase